MDSIRAIHSPTFEMPLDTILEPLRDNSTPLDKYDLIQLDTYHWISLYTHHELPSVTSRLYLIPLDT